MFGRRNNETTWTDGCEKTRLWSSGRWVIWVSTSAYSCDSISRQPRLKLEKKKKIAGRSENTIATAIGKARKSGRKVISKTGSH